ncbi:glycosyltransferase family 2 protein [Terrimonas sp.]|uniref:glycosyltransferase family 2 protein n=1 Tax=Terrimonas sp. TaxID=1914338 RepID=UPI000D521568|nr:glycosyltransferase family A protein [Terrimonas sp.]PVD52024.1 glycosyltransferase family 2 protein [Terrimonas sp.]
MLISVVIPCYNVEKYIQECLISVYNQTHPSLEVICIDNNSTDSTFEYLEYLRNTYYPSLIVLSESRAGAPFARNKGMYNAKGDWIQFLDADDIIEKNKISHQCSLIPMNENIGYIVSGCKYKDIDGNFIINSFLSNDKFTSAFIRQSGNTCSNLWNKKHLLAIGGWNVELKSSQETDLMFRLTLNGSSYLVDNEINTVIRAREEGQISQSEPGLRWSRFIDVRLCYLKCLKSKYPNVYNTNRDIFYNYLLWAILILLKYDKSAALKYFTYIKKENWRVLNLYGISKKKGYFIRFLGLNAYNEFMRIKNIYTKL